MVKTNKSLKMRIKIAGENSKVIAYSHTTLGECYHAQDQYTETHDEYQKALWILLELEGDSTNTLDIADVHHNISCLYNAQNSFRDDIYYMKKCIDIYEQIIGGNNVKVAKAVRSIGIGYEKLEQFDEAILYHKKNLDIVMQLRKNTDMMLFNAYSSLSEIYTKQKRNVDAISLYEKWLHYDLLIYEEIHQQQINQRRASFYDELEKLYREIKNHDMANKMKRLANNFRRDLRRRAKESELGKLLDPIYSYAVLHESNKLIENHLWM